MPVLHTSTRTLTRILKPFENSEPTGLKVDIAQELTHARSPLAVPTCAFVQPDDVGPEGHGLVEEEAGGQFLWRRHRLVTRVEEEIGQVEGEEHHTGHSSPDVGYRWKTLEI